jgi:hypothetical protein
VTSRADEAVEKAADKLQEAADKAAGQSGLRARLADELADDAAFVRKLKPSLMVARAKGEAPRDGKPNEGVVAPTGPQLGPRPPNGKNGKSGPNPFVVIGIALVAGILLAKIVDWRGRAHPR